MVPTARSQEVRRQHLAKRGRPKTATDIEKLILDMPSNNPGWGYTRICVALYNLGHEIGRNTVKRILLKSTSHTRRRDGNSSRSQFVTCPNLAVRRLLERVVSHRLLQRHVDTHFRVGLPARGFHQRLYSADVPPVFE